MKILILATSVFLLTQYMECRHTIKSRRSIDVFESIWNKSMSYINYVKKTGRDLKDATIDTANNTMSYIRRGKDYIFNTAESKATKLKQTLQKYIDKAEETAGTIYDSIAPEQVDYECSDKDTAIHMTAPQLITLHGYFVESHIVVTEDGYLLTLHRLPLCGTNSSKEIPTKTVLLHHGLLGSSIDWVLPGPKKSLPYILCDAGYDVWITNVRGNTYSKAHISRNIDSYDFWDFSFHEVGYYDLPAVIDYIMYKKGKPVEINYIGFSMGTTALFTLLSTKPKYNDILRAGFTLAPIAYMSDVKSPFKLLAKFGHSFEYFMKLLGANEFLPRNALVRYLSKHSCKLTHYEEALCEMSMFLLCGNDKDRFDRSLVPLILGHVPAGASTKTLAHYAQEIHNNGDFHQFDYGANGNIKQYGNFTPPKYPVNKITLPIALLSAKDDWLSSVKDAKKLYAQLINPIEHFIVPDNYFSHLDFLFARDAPSLVYDKLLLLLESSYAKSDVEVNAV